MDSVAAVVVEAMALDVLARMLDASVLEVPTLMRTVTWSLNAFSHNAAAARSAV